MNNLRVIAGTARRTGLIAPKGQNTRPTADRIKENIFNIITSYVQNAHFLDLFAGSGAMGIEALSRGAGMAVFVDSAKDAVSVILANLTNTKFAARAHVLPMCALTAIPKLEQDGRKFDIIFLDPPYGQGLMQQALTALVKHNILSQDGLIIAECAANEPTYEVAGLAVHDIRKYGSTRLIFYMSDKMFYAAAEGGMN